MNEERLIEMLSNNTLKKVKKAVKPYNISTAGNKISIIVRIKVAILTDDSKFRNIFSNIFDVFLSAWSCVLP